MTDSKKRLKLSLMLTAYALMSLILAAALFLGGRALGRYIADDVIYTKQRVLDTEISLYSEFCAYLKTNDIGDANDEARISPWFNDKSSLIVFIYDYYRQSDGALSSIGSFIYGSDEDTVIYSSVSDPASTYSLLQSEYADYWYYAPLEMRGENGFPKVIRMMYFPMYTARNYVNYISAALAFFAFALCLTLLFRRKTKYISLLSEQLNAMSAGDLTTPMPIKGRDELTSLAENMDEMRLSFIERLNREEQLNKNASALLTDISHDLRTPLTALIGYLEILDSKQADPQSAQKFIASAKARAYQIKGMTDELFEYFLVYSYDESRLSTETLDAQSLFAQLWDEASFGIENAGFTLQTSFDDKPAYIDANPLLLKRVFDNIASNILKYADKSQPVVASFSSDNEAYRAEISNAIASAPTDHESSHIGLSSCQKIAALHQGAFTHQTGSNAYKCELLLPIVKK